MFKRPTLGFRTHKKLLKEFHQGGIAVRWSERRLLILLAEYRLNCRREFHEELCDELEAEPNRNYYTISKPEVAGLAH